ncbi:CMP-N,N'-diacetyllegionaminic acid synthase [Novipirellula aureliae]|uniref:CMP-N,N'-diacetyllegionaminic acid synthase n=1 Tax=Novipirellula aureliae TaxID=2527966 RepID=A0A5C6DLL3_9BACT|nr:pseudaminic acid cytidylyltransferase [Novipirellula aureliae]TWU37668.1 CMP-N,N'-diacetyllegionaminic acid synthase [Novipirellula aureliae]
MNIAVIPARGGSKRIPGKNIREFCGQPIIKYSIDAAKQTKLFDRIIVSTDCPEISKVAVENGAEVPFVRPPELSDDFTPTIPVVRHAVNWICQNDRTVHYACCLYATAPFVQSEDMIRGMQKLEASPDASFAFSVTTFAFPIFRALQVHDERVSMFWPEHESTRSQDLPEAFHDAGQFYWGTTDAWMKDTQLFSSQSIPISIPRYRVQDIDTLEDWQRAERMYEAIDESQRR